MDQDELWSSIDFRNWTILVIRITKMAFFAGFKTLWAWPKWHSFFTGVQLLWILPLEYCIMVCLSSLCRNCFAFLSTGLWNQIKSFCGHPRYNWSPVSASAQYYSPSPLVALSLRILLGAEPLYQVKPLLYLDSFISYLDDLRPRISHLWFGVISLSSIK